MSKNRPDNVAVSEEALVVADRAAVAQQVVLEWEAFLLAAVPVFLRPCSQVKFYPNSWLRSSS